MRLKSKSRSLFVSCLQFPVILIDKVSRTGFGSALSGRMSCTALTLHRNSGGYSVGVPPLPIPNREVKPVRADGTAHPWESRSPPFFR